MQTQLARIAGESAHAEGRLDGIIATVPAERWPVRNDPSSWSVSECIAHLNLTSEAYLPRLRNAIDEARALPPLSGRLYRRQLKGWMLSAMIGPLPVIRGRRIGKVKTTAAFIPEGGLPQAELVADFRRLQKELGRALAESDGLQIDRVSIVSPFGEKLRYDCFSAFVILPRHQERHLGQAERVWAR